MVFVASAHLHFWEESIMEHSMRLPNRRLILNVLLLLLPFSCTIDIVAQSWLDKAKKMVKDVKELSKEISPAALTEDEAAKGIREALSHGVSKGSTELAKVDGYFANPSIKIPFPEDARKVETSLRGIGMGSKIDDAVLSLNRAAEKAAVEARPIFLSAIQKMSVQDALGIVRGGDRAATDYLERVCGTQLLEKFKPVITQALDKVDATKYWTSLMVAYNSIPLVEKVNTDLADYTTRKAISGLFVMIAKEELAIRKDPAARTTALLKKVFGNS